MKKLLLPVLAASLLMSCKNGTSNTKTAEGNPTIENAVAQPKSPKSEGTKRILMVGNSHTEYYVSLPELLTTLCKENGQQVQIDKLLAMGVSIDQILSENEAKAAQLFSRKDNDGNYYDYIILQEKTPVALTDLDEYKENCKKVVDMLKANSPNAAIYVYELNSPLPYTEKSDFEEAKSISFDNANAVAKSLPNAGVLYIGEKIADAYSGKNGYNYLANGKDVLRAEDDSKHIINDGGFMASIYIYKTLFGTNPKIPAQLPLSTGTGDKDEIKMQEVSKAISNPTALAKIAES